MRAALGAAEPTEGGVTMAERRRPRSRRRARRAVALRSASRRQRGLLIAIVVFLVLLGVVASIGSRAPHLFRSLADGGERRDAGAGRDRADPRHPVRRLRSLGGRGRSRSSMSCWRRICRTRRCRRSSLVAAGVGDRHGAPARFNGFFVAVLRMQPIVVTLATMFILQGVTLLVMDKPGGQVSPALGDLLARRRHSQPAAAADRAHRHRARALGCGSSARAFGTRASTPSAATSRRRARSASASGARSSWSMSSAAAAMAWRACSSARRRARAIRWSAIPCCCRCSPRSSSAARARRRARRPAGLGVRRLHPDDGRQYPAGAQRLRLLLDASRRASILILAVLGGSIRADSRSRATCGI